MRNIKLDMHTHTLASGHAFGTINEMLLAAKDKNLELIGITEHGPSIPGACNPFYFLNLRVIPRMQYGVKVMFGAEMNILDYKGTLDLNEKHIKNLDLRIAGIHRICYTAGSIDENTSAIVNAIKNPDVDIISHPDDGNCPLDYEAVVNAAKEYHTLLEINNNALRSPSRKDVAKNQTTILNLCKKAGIPVICNSDAHYMNDLGNIDHLSKVIDGADFPEGLIINYSTEDFEKFIAINAKSRSVTNVYMNNLFT